MFQKITNFIKYHNSFAIGISLVLVLSFSAMASEDVRNVVIGEEIITEQGIDNLQLLYADLENFNINLKINNVSEDEENYYVDYTFNTIAVRDNIWQPVIKLEKFTVNKNALKNRDLGIYLAEELSEVARGEMAYLKEAQKTERERGMTQIVKTTDYTGLIGLTLDLKNKILPGYEPVIKLPEIVVQLQPETIIPSQPSEIPAVPLSELTSISTEPSATSTPPDIPTQSTSTEPILAEPTATSTPETATSSVSEISATTTPSAAELSSPATTTTTPAIIKPTVASTTAP